MSLQIMMAAVTLLVCLMNAGAFSEALSEMRPGRSLNGNFYPNSGQLGDDGSTYVSGNLLDMLMAGPSKRQWCRKGMVYNHVLGSCMLSFSALRGKSKLH